MTNDFGKTLKKARLKAGFSGPAFSKEAGTHASTLFQVEKGRRSPPPDNVKSWAKVLNISGQKLVVFMRLAQAARAYAQIEARPELDALNAELELQRTIIEALINMIDDKKALKADLSGIFARSIGYDTLLAIEGLLKANDAERGK